MQVRIETQPTGPLSVLSELPDARLALLEGLNGIGKTLAVRLLQICTTGTTPYRTESQAWASLCNGLGDFRIEISRLNGASTIEWMAHTHEWLGKDDVSTSFKRITIDGRESTLKDLRRLLVVHRLAGDETLIETLAQQADSDENVITRWARNTASASDAPLARLEALAGNILTMLGDWSADRYRALLREMNAAQINAKEAGDAAEAASKKLEKVTEAVELRRRLDLLQRSAPDLHQRIGAVDEAIAKKKTEAEGLQERIVARAKQAARRESVLRELRNAQHTLKRNQQKLSAAFETARAAAATLQLEPTLQALQPVESMLRQSIDGLTRRQLAMDAAPAMRSLLDEVSIKLADGEAHGLADQVALDDPETDVELTVTQTRVGIVTRRAQLEGQPPPPEAKEVSEQLVDAQSRLQLVLRLAGYIASVDRYRRLVNSNEARVDEALSAASPRSLAELQQLEAQRRELDKELLELAAERAVLRQQLGNLGSESAVVVGSRLTAIVNGIGITDESLPVAIDAARESEQDARQKLADARQRLTTLRRDVARAEADVKRTTRSLRSSAELRWLPEALGPSRAPGDGETVEQQLAGIDRLRARVEGAIERLGTHRTQLAAVGAALRGIGRHMRGQDAEAVEYVPQLEEWFGRQFSEWFNSPKVRHELLPNADEAIKVDVRQREVRWVERGHERSRPLEAFSSGEQAFAYTRARLAVLDQELAKAPNRLIVLDEFGAFIAHDRLSGLLSYLTERAKDHPEDQVLVVLPLSHDYASEARNSSGPTKVNLQRLADQIESRRFAIQVLVE